MPADRKHPQKCPGSEPTPTGGCFETTPPTLRQKRMGADEVSRLLAEAHRGDVEAQREIGIIYFRGFVVRRNPAEAFRWLALAVEAGDSQAMAHLEILLPGLAGDDIAEGRRLIARYRGEPEPEYGFGGEIFSSELLQQLEHKRAATKEAFPQWQPVEADEALTESPSERPLPLAAPVLLANSTSQTTDVIRYDLDALPRQSVPIIADPAFAPAKRRWLAPLSFSFTVVMLSAAFALLGKSLLTTADRVKHEPVHAKAAEPVVTAVETTNPLPRDEGRKQSPSVQAEVSKLTPLSAALPFSLREIPSDLSASWRNLDVLRSRAITGDARAQYELAQWHLLQARDTNDFVVAVRWLQLAAASGHPQALNNLGFCHVTGTGTPLDLVEAYKCFALATTAGLQAARGNREMLASQITPEQLAKASGKIAAVMVGNRPEPASPLTAKESSLLDTMNLAAEPDTSRQIDSRAKFLAPAALPLELSSFLLGP